MSVTICFCQTDTASGVFLIRRARGRVLPPRPKNPETISFSLQTGSMEHEQSLLVLVRFLDFDQHEVESIRKKREAAAAWEGVGSAAREASAAAFSAWGHLKKSLFGRG